MMPASDAFALATRFAWDRLSSKISAHRPVSIAMGREAIGSHRQTSSVFSEREFPLDILFSTGE
jgi:hypothetical protein